MCQANSRGYTLNQPLLTYKIKTTTPSPWLLEDLKQLGHYPLHILDHRGILILWQTVSGTSQDHHPDLPRHPLNNHLDSELLILILVSAGWREVSVSMGACCQD